MEWLGRNREAAKSITLAALSPGDLAQAGAKAVALAQLLRAGLPVPPGFVITAGAFRRALRSSPSAEPEKGADAQEGLTLFQIPRDVERGIKRALNRMPQVRLWAVRSSATAEDLPQASFAGQYESFLNVPRDQVADSVRRCWASLFSPRAVAYRIRNKIPNDQIAMAVIVQEMVSAEMAGVLFTADPVSGDANRMVMEGAPGTGDKVVEGRVTPRRVVLSRITCDILESDGEGAVDGLARDLAELALRAEHVLGSRLDIEWAVSRGEIQLLQARPITGLASAKGWEDRQYWTNINTAEVIPDVTTPATWSLLQRLLEPLFRSVFALHGADVRAWPIMGLVAGRVCFNANAGLAAVKPFWFVLERIHDVALALGGGRIDASRRLVGSIYEGDLPDLGFRWHKYVLSWPEILRNVIKHSPRRGDAWMGRLKARMDELERVEVEGLSTPELMSFYSKTGSQTFEGWDLLYVLTQSMALPVFRNACRKWLKDPELTLGYRLFSGLGGVAEAEAGLALWRLAVLAHGDEQTERVLVSGDTWVVTLEKLRQTEPGREFIRHWEAFMLEHGHHGRGELELYNPRWRETPDYVLSLLRSYIGSVEQVNPVRNQQRLSEERRRLTEECLRRLRNPLKRWLFSRSLARAQKLTINREEWKNQAVRHIVFLRRGLLELGRRLEREHALDERDDIFFLEFAEIEELSAGKAAGELRERIRSRRVEYVRNLTLSPPAVALGRFVPGSRPVSRPRSDGKVLEGMAVSPGTIIGRAKVIMRSDNHARVLPGEILIAPYTDPAWTPYFVTAAGVVSDVGGILSHGSIVAREYGLPAVTNVGCATQAIETGDLVEVDGNLGRVRILEYSSRPNQAMPA